MTDYFHAIIHAAPESTPETAIIELDGQPLSTLRLSQLQTRFEMSFEDVAEAFEALPRMFLEPDGSFVWVAGAGRGGFQLDGLLVDDGVRLLTVEVKGQADQGGFEQFLRSLGWPGQSVVFQLVTHGIYLSEGEFRKRFVTPE